MKPAEGRTNLRQVARTLLVLCSLAGAGCDQAPDAPGLRASGQVLLDLSNEGDPNHSFYQVRGMASVAGGTIVVADGGSNELRVFDASGRHQRTLGRSGAGPREFGRLAGVFPLGGDTVITYDRGNNRVAIWLIDDGRLLDSYSLEGTTGAALPILRTVLSDRTLVLLGRPFAIPRGTAGIQQETTQVILDSPPWGDPQPVGTISDRSYLSQVGRTPLPFAAAPWVVAGEPGAIAVLDHGAALRDLDPMTPAMHHELPGVSIPVTAEMEQRYRDWRLSRVGEGALRARLRVFLDDTPFADSVPPFDQMLAGPNGTLWLRRYRMPWLDDDTTATDRWMQLDRERRVVRECLAPPQLRPMAWERDRVLGVWRDELRVEHPVVARLTTIDGEPCP